MILTVEQMRKLVRPFSTDEKTVAQMMVEAWREDVRPRIGADLAYRIENFNPDGVGMVIDDKGGIRIVDDGGIRTMDEDTATVSVQKGRMRTLKGGAMRLAKGGIRLLERSSYAYSYSYGNDFFDAVEKLFDGCYWTDRCRGQMRVHSGLRTALAYYTYARIIRDGNIQATRFGAVLKDDSYSTRAEMEEQHRQYNEVFSQAESYLRDVLAFINDHADVLMLRRRRMDNFRNKVRIIGK